MGYEQRSRCGISASTWCDYLKYIVARGFLRMCSTCRGDRTEKLLPCHLCGCEGASLKLLSKITPRERCGAKTVEILPALMQLARRAAYVEILIAKPAQRIVRARLFTPKICAYHSPKMNARRGYAANVMCSCVTCVDFVRPRASLTLLWISIIITCGCGAEIVAILLAQMQLVRCAKYVEILIARPVMRIALPGWFTQRVSAYRSPKMNVRHGYAANVMYFCVTCVDLVRPRASLTLLC